MKTYSLTVLLLFLYSTAQAQSDTLTTAQAQAYIGKTIWIKMYVAELHAGKNDSPDYLNIDKEYPNQTLAIAIFDHNVFKQKTGYSPQSLVGKTIVCHAKITQYKGKTQISQNDLKKIRTLK